MSIYFSAKSAKLVSHCMPRVMGWGGGALMTLLAEKDKQTVLKIV